MAEAVPFAFPLQETLVELPVAVIEGGDVIVTEVEAEQPPLSFTVQVYVPAARPEAVAEVAPEGDQE